MYLFPLTVSKSDRCIRYLKITTNGDENTISVGSFKLVSPYFTDILCKIMNKSINSGSFPDMLRCASIPGKPRYDTGMAPATRCYKSDTNYKTVSQNESFPLRIH